jgi:uncharacterized protein (DUF2384 family)
MSANLVSVIRKPEFHQAMIDPIARIDRERKGMPVHMAEALRKQMGLSAGEFSRIFGIKPATYKKKVADKEPLAGRYGDAVADLGETLAIAHNLLPAGRDDLDIPRWFAQWITIPQPSLGGRKPADIMDTPTGRALVKQVVGAMGSGAYL